MVIGDEEETDKVHFRELFGGPFEQVRLQTFEWLQKQRLAVLPTMVGGRETGYHGLLIAPDNAGFFICLPVMQPRSVSCSFSGSPPSEYFSAIRVFWKNKTHHSAGGTVG